MDLFFMAFETTLSSLSQRSDWNARGERKASRVFVVDVPTAGDKGLRERSGQLALRRKKVTEHGLMEGSGQKGE